MRNRLTAVGEAEPVELEFPAETAAAAPPPRVARDAIAAGLMLALKTLSQKSIVALASLVDAAMISSAFILWLMVVPSPSLLQLATVIAYAAFILVCLWIRRRTNAG